MQLTGAFNNTRHCTALTNGSNGYYCLYIENGLEPGTAVIKIDAKDNASNSATPYYLGITTSAGFKYNLSLVNNWNLVSTPLILENTSIDNIVANNSNITKIYSYDGSTPWTWWLSDGADTLTTMEPLKGYWVYTTGATTMQFFGNKTTGTPPRGYGLSNPRSLSASTWYLIGHYMSNFSSSSYNTDDTLSAMCTGGLCSGASTLKFSSLQWYDTSAGELSPMLKTSYNADGRWTRGRGFWVYMNSAHTFQGTPS